MIDQPPSSCAHPGLCDVLIVGDAALCDGLMRAVLTRLGYGVVCVADAIEAFAALAHERADVVLVALHLADRGGIDFVQDLRRRRGAARHLPVIVFGDARDREAARRDCRRAGAQAYIQKPISVSRLLSAIWGLIRLAPAGNAPPKPGDPMSTPVDLAYLSDVSDGDTQLERELLALYLTTAEGYLRDLRHSLDAPAAWGRAAHALKGSSRGVGAGAVAALAEQAEHAAPSNALLEGLETALQQSCRYLGEHRPEALPPLAETGA